MSVISAGIRVIPWQVLGRNLPTTPLIPDRIQIEEMRVEDLGRLDEDPADPTPPKKQKPKPKSPVGDLDTLPDPQTQPQPTGPRWRVDPKTCTITRPPGKAQDELKTQACIAWNVAQAMTEAYNRGYATGRAVSKKYKLRCPRARDDAAWLDKRLKRIILSQEKGPRRRAIKPQARSGRRV